MKFAVGLLLCAVCANAAVTGNDHPIVKVINMLKKLKDTSINEGKDEAVAYTKFQYWCSTSKDTLSEAIADEKETIGELEDKLSGLKKRKESLEEDIGTLEDQIKENEAAAAAAKKNRKAEAGLYKKANDDLGSTIKAVQGCIEALEGAETTTESMMLAQKRVKMALSLIGMKATVEQRQGLEAFADPKKRPKQLAAGDLAGHVDKYDFKSENVIELLKNLKMKFQDDKLAGTKAETNSINAYDQAKLARDNAHKAASKSKSLKTTDLKETDSSIATANKNLKSTNSDLDKDSQSLSDTNDACRTKASEWEKRSQVRTDEIAAMDQAVKILAKSSNVRTEAPGNPIPPASPVFLQLSQLKSSDPKMKAVALLKAAAQEGHSRALERLAQEVAAHLNGPFDQVNNMIEKMIFRLMDEQKQEDEHKHWCDQEIEKTEVMRDDKLDRIKNLKADIKDQVAKVGELTSEIKDARDMIANIISFVAEATEIRNTGKSENALAVKDAKDAQTSLTNAIAVLEAFYKESGEVAKEPWEFIQAVNLPKNPATWDSPEYTGQSGPDKEGGIITVLQAVQDDFAKMESETKAQEAIDQEEFEKSMSANDIEKAGREQEVDMKSSEKARRTEKIASLESQKKDTEGELEKTNLYLHDLQPACVDTDKGASYQNRKDARTKEIDALKTAQNTLLDAFKEQKQSKFLQINRH